MQDTLLKDLSDAELAMITVVQLCDDCMTWVEEQGLPAKVRLTLNAIMCTTKTALDHIRKAEDTVDDLGRQKAA